MKAKASITSIVAKNIGSALRNKGVATKLTEIMIEVRLGDFFRPIVREAIADALDCEPDDLGPEIVEEGLRDSITAAYLATKWLEEKRIPEMVASLQKQYGDQYEGFESDNITQVALNYLITRDDTIVIANAIRDGLLTEKV